MIAPVFLALVVAQAEPMKCEAGPLDRSFGRSEWVVYGCSDGRSVVVAAKEGNPAGPFFFIFAAKGETYELYGEGDGDKAASDAAYADLQKLDTAAIAGLYAQATAVVPKP
jgi:hypothetical protein